LGRSNREPEGVNTWAVVCVLLVMVTKHEHCQYYVHSI
jgi:hypothetical protein